MLIVGLQKFSLLDYPGRVSCIVFTVGCNFGCGYCHNPELIRISKNSPFLDEEELLGFLVKRKGKLDAVVITGGEPTLQKDLCDFIKKVKAMGFLVKLDTNGTNPDVLSLLLDEKLLDYIAMDIKGPLARYSEIVNKDVDVNKINESIQIIMNSRVDHEFRTTIVKGQLKEEDFVAMSKLISGAKRYFLQKFVPSKTHLAEFMKKEAYDRETMNKFAKIMAETVKYVAVR
ncbi:MAG: anaerobic ribonucleoside-triphosphate reductase activating protein [Patescibacteria group bacterium]|jgi:pyruvate formate lyase activating enzyme